MIGTLPLFLVPNVMTPVHHRLDPGGDYGGGVQLGPAAIFRLSSRLARRQRPDLHAGSIFGDARRGGA
ncbi:hypothetical protein MJ588_13315 [Klebsiella pneumoniae]|nr:hypothetical protein MJ588_13315 [Klebsiella pneumoniae]